MHDDNIFNYEALEQLRQQLSDDDIHALEEHRNDTMSSKFTKS